MIAVVCRQLINLGDYVHLDQVTGIRDSAQKIAKDRKGAAEFEEEELVSGVAEHLPGFQQSIGSSSTAEALQGTLGAESMKSFEASLAPVVGAPVTPIVRSADAAHGGGGAPESSKKRRKYDAAAQTANLQAKATREVQAQKKSIGQQISDAQQAVSQVTGKQS